jgi:hypothetical protein
MIRINFFIGCPFKGKLIVDFFQQLNTDGIHQLTLNANVPSDGCLLMAFDEHFISSNTTKFLRNSKPPRCFHKWQHDEKTVLNI